MTGRKKAGATDAAQDAQPSGTDPIDNQGDSNVDLNPQQSVNVDAADGGNAVGNTTEDQNAENVLASATAEATSDVAVQSDEPQVESVKPIVVTSGLSFSLTVPPTYQMIGAGQRVEIIEANEVIRGQIVSNLEQLKLLHGAQLVVDY